MRKPASRPNPTARRIRPPGGLAGRLPGLGRILAPLLAALLLPAAARGQEEPQAADTFELREMVVSALRLPTPRDAVPLSVTVLRGDELRARGLTRVADALRGVPGLGVVETGSWGGQASLFVRGGESDYVQVLLDGVPLNEPGGALDLGAVSLTDVERIEVVRGPASVLYGSDAVTGIVHIFTRNGSGRAVASVRAGAGSHGTTEWETGVRGAAGRLGYSVALSRFATDGVLEVNNDFRNLVGAASGRWSFGDAGHLALSVRRTDHEYHFPTDGAGRVVDDNTFAAGLGTIVSLELARTLTPWLETVLLLGSNALDADLVDEQDGPADTLGFYASSSSRELRTRTADLRANLRLPGAVLITLGGVWEGERERGRSESLSEFGPASDRSDLERTGTAAYAQLLWSPLRRLSLTGGVRLEDAETFGSFATYRAGAVVGLAEGLRARAVVGTGFKAPNLFENFAEGFVRGNPDLEPEQSRSWEVGLEADAAGGALTVSGSWFDQRFRDLIDFTFEPPEGQSNYFNVARADAAGLELAATAAPLSSLRATLGYTWLRTEATDPGFDPSPEAQFAPGRPLVRRPEHHASLLLVWSPGSRASGSLRIARTGSREDLDFREFPARRVRLPAFTTVDIGAQLPVLRGEGRWPPVSAVLRLENALDAEFENPANFPGRGRSFLVAVRSELRL